MKKLIPLLLALVMALSLTAVASASTVYTEGALYYTIADESITITGYFGRDEVVTVPASIAGIPVNTIAKGAFTGSSAVRVVDLPDTITTVEEGAFASGITVNYNSNIVQPDDPTPPDDGKQDDPTKPGDPAKPDDGKKDDTTKPGNSGGTTDTGSVDVDTGTTGNNGNTGNTGNTGTAGNTGSTGNTGNVDSGIVDSNLDEGEVDLDEELTADGDAQPAAPEQTGSVWGWVILGVSVAALAVVLVVRSRKKDR